MFFLENGAFVLILEGFRLIRSPYHCTNKLFKPTAMKNLFHTSNTLSRFELIPNTSHIGTENAFSIYGILIIPQLLGGVFLYHAFEIRGIFFWVALGVLTLILVNVYIFYKRTSYRDHVLKLIIDNTYIQMMNYREIQFQSHIEDVKIEMIKCGRQGYPAIKLSNEELPSFIIGLKQPLQNQEMTQSLIQPDYWLKNKKEWEYLYERLLKRNRMAA